MIPVIINVVIVALAAYAVYEGYRRGLVLIAFELLSFLVATFLALQVYRPAGAVFKNWLHVTAALGHVAAFVTVWTLTEVACAVLIRFQILTRIRRDIHLTRFNRVGGSLLNIVKATAFIMLGLIVYNGLPMPASWKQPPRDAYLSRQLLAASGHLPQAFGSGLVQDFSDSLDFFTVPAEPESEKRIDLGYTTTNVKVDEKDEQAMLVLLNHERTSRGLKPLTLNLKARTVARAYSQEMFARGYFSHVDPEGKTPFDRMKAGGVEYATAGENLALAPTLQQAHDGLMKSPGHRANILSPDYHTVGIGIMDGGPYGLMITQDFTD